MAALALSWPGLGLAQSSRGPIEIGIQVASAISSEFDSADIGVGGRFSWHPAALVGIEAELDGYPGDFPETHPFSRSRMEGLFGVTMGPEFERVRPFARLRLGFVSFRKAPQTFLCIMIFPPPLSCALAGGRNVFALDIGGGAEVFATRKASLRLDAGDRILRYPGPVFDRNRMAHDNALFSHNFRLAVGAGVRF